MNFYNVINGINSLCALGITLFIFFNRKARKPIQLSFALFSLLLSVWAFAYLMWGLQTEKEASLWWLRLLKFPVCFTHVAYFHFILIFTNRVREYNRALILGYLQSGIFTLINSGYGLFDLTILRNRNPYLFCPQASMALILLIVAEVLYLLFGWSILLSSIRKEEDAAARLRLKYFILIGVIGWSGALTNWFFYFDFTPTSAIGNPLVTFFVFAVALLIFKHNLLELNLAFRKTFVYGALTLFIMLIYIVFIVISERLFQSYFKYNSILLAISAALAIALLFNPLRHALIKFVDLRFFGKNIAELSAENLIMKNELKRQDQMKAVATLAAGMAHEIKNPLTSIRTFAEYLPIKYNDPEFRNRFMKVVTDEVDRVNNIVQQLLEFSKPQPPNLRDCSLSDLAEDTLSLLNKNLVEGKIRVVKDYAAEVPVRADKNQMRQAILNILLNAIQAMPNGGVLTIKTTLDGGYFQLSVSDTGSGIPKEDLSRIFDPFFTTKDQGTGLGLAIVHGIIKEHQGRIEARSELGQGTTFTLFLKISR